MLRDPFDTCPCGARLRANGLCYFQEYDVLKKISQKTYLIIGTRDTTGPGRAWKRRGVNYKLGQYNKLGKSAKSQIQNATLLELPGLGHMPQFEDYERFSSVFLPIVK